MPRSRMIKPDFWNDEKLATLTSRDARLTYIALWNFADDYGVVKANSSYLKNSIYPYDDRLNIKTFKKWLAELEFLKRILPFEVNGETYYWMPKFLDHQSINRPSKQRNPPPPDILSEDSLSTHGVLTDETETETEVETETETEDKQKDVLSLSEWLDKDLWKEFKKYRREIGAKVTVHGEKLLICDLKKLVDDGHDQHEVVNQTIKSGKWKGFYPLKNNNDNNGDHSEIKNWMNSSSKH